MSPEVRIRAPDDANFNVRLAGHGTVSVPAGEERTLYVSGAVKGYAEANMAALNDQLAEDDEAEGEAGAVAWVNGDADTSPDEDASGSTEGVDPDSHYKPPLVAAAEDLGVEVDGRTKADYAAALTDAGYTDADVEAYADAED